MLEPRVRPFKRRPALLRVLRDFVALRPVVTVRLLRVIWWVYLVAQGWRLIGFVWLMAGSSAIQPSAVQLASLAGSAVYPVLNVLLVRILLEVAAVVLCGRAYGQSEQGEGSSI